MVCFLPDLRLCEIILKVHTRLAFGEVRAFFTGLQKFVSYLDHGVLKFIRLCTFPVWLLLADCFHSFLVMCILGELLLILFIVVGRVF